MSLAALFVTNGTTADAVAAELGLDPALFDRIEDGTQPLPLDLVDEITAVTDIGRGEIVEAVAFVTVHEGPEARYPRPPPPLSPFRPVVYAKTLPVES